MDIEVEVDLDNQLIADLIAYTGIHDVQELVRQALRELAEREKLQRSSQSDQRA